MENIKSIIKKHRKTLAGVIAGSVFGYLYWRFVGCSSGSCPITSSPLNSTLFGAVFGGLLFNNFEKERKKDNENNKK